MRRAATPDESNEMARVNSDSSLVEISPRGPDGFIYQQNFISEAEEQETRRSMPDEVSKISPRPTENLKS
jgi:hypothetical protein